MSGVAVEDGIARPGSSVVADGPVEFTGVPVIDTAAVLGPRGDTYEEEFAKLKDLLQRRKDLLGPPAPVIYVNIARNLFVDARKIVSDPALAPYSKCSLLFQIFDALVLVYKNLSFVYCDKEGVRSVYGYSDRALKALLSRIEAIARQVAVSIHDAYSLTVLNNVVATTEQRLSQVQSERDMLEFFRGVSGGSDTALTMDTAASSGLPRGIEAYKSTESAALVQRLYSTNGDKHYVREFYETVFLLATSNAPATLSSALETRLADKDRNIVLFDAPGDRMFASSMCASAIAFLRKRLDEKDRPGGGIETYRINYSRIFSKFRGESERNFDNLMEWIKKKVRGSDTFRAFWFPDIENLMSPRTGADQEHIQNIKNAMLQHMDAFNKDRTLRSFLLLFNSSEGDLDSAFSRRLETVIKTPHDPLTDLSVAKEVVGAALDHYHINLTDGRATEVAVRAGTFNTQSGRVGGFASVQAALREMYVNQKLMLSYDSRALPVSNLSSEVYDNLLGRYASEGSHDTLYDLDENPRQLTSVHTIAFSPASGLADLESSPLRYNANIRGDPKDIDELAASRTVFVHD